MQRIRLLGLALVAMLALSALAASGASAAHILWLVNGKHLKAGETRLLLATAKTAFLLSTSVSKVECEGLTLPNSQNMDLVGPEQSKEILLFTGCVVKGAGTNCKVENGQILTNLIINTLGFPTASPLKGPILVLFEPAGANHGNGNVFVTIKLTGSECVASSLPAVGQQIGEAFVNGHPVERPEDALHGEVVFKAPGPKTIFINLVTVKTSISLGGLPATLTGTALLLVDENGVPVNWGINWSI